MSRNFNLLHHVSPAQARDSQAARHEEELKSVQLMSGPAPPSEERLQSLGRVSRPGFGSTSSHGNRRTTTSRSCRAVNDAIEEYDFGDYSFMSSIISESSDNSTSPFRYSSPSPTDVEEGEEDGRRKKTTVDLFSKLARTSS